jgi:hypothetical protein
MIILRLWETIQTMSHETLEVNTELYAQFCRKVGEDLQIENYDFLSTFNCVSKQKQLLRLCNRIEDKCRLLIGIDDDDDSKNEVFTILELVQYMKDTITKFIDKPDVQFGL